jgi:superfamily I DNA/RNA helicase
MTTNGKRIPSPQQAKYYDWIVNGSGSAVVRAVAGSGKTTALIDGLPLMKGRKFFGAYNKKIAVEIAERAGQQDGLFVSTMHAAGFGAWRRAARDVKVNKDKCRDIFRELAQARPVDDGIAGFESATLELVSYAKQGALGVGTLRIEDDNVWHKLIDHFDVDTLGDDELVVGLARDVLKRSIDADHLMIDFDDMIYAPLIHNARVFEHDWVLVDEAQDTNRSRRLLALRLLRRGGRLVAVGDPHQAIYGFTGADSDSLDLIAKAVNACDLPLTVSYRCPRAVVAYAQRFVSHIEAHPSAPEGKVDSVGGDVSLATLAKPGDAILSRFNAPLIGYAYSFISAGIPARVEGREIGAGLKQLARRWRVNSFPVLLDRLEGYCERETAKYRAKEQESRAVGVEDKCECLRVLVARIARTEPRPGNAVQRLCDEIDSIFGDNVGGDVVLLSSIHKSKGREWPHVFWLQTGPSKWARQEWELEQENNLCYVAVTRAKEHLTLVGI